MFTLTGKSTCQKVNKNTEECNGPMCVGLHVNRTCIDMLQTSGYTGPRTPLLCNNGFGIGHHFGHLTFLVTHCDDREKKVKMLIIFGQWSMYMVHIWILCLAFST